MVDRRTPEEITEAYELEKALAGRDMDYLCDWIHGYTRSKALKAAQDRRRSEFDKQFTTMQRAFQDGGLEQMALEMVASSRERSLNRVKYIQSLRKDDNEN